MSIQIEQLSEEEREEIINYGIRRSIVISISTIVTIMAGYLLGIVWQSIFFLFCFSALRKYAGGYHDVIYNQLYKIPEKCKYCICQSICSGGCMHDNLLLMKNINIPAECNCKLQKFLTEQALKIYISLTDIDKKYLFGEESCYGG